MEISRPDRSIRLARSRVGPLVAPDVVASDVSPIAARRARPARPTRRRSTSAAILRATRSPKVSSRSSDCFIRWISTPVFLAFRTLARRCSYTFRPLELQHRSTKWSLLRPLIPQILIRSSLSITILPLRRIASQQPCSFRILGAAMPQPTPC
jgi:hypothetical protein